MLELVACAEQRGWIKMRRINRAMRRAVDYSGLMYWNYIISVLDAEKLREKDQDSRNAKK